MYQILFSCFSVGGHLRFVRVLVIVNSAALNIGVHLFLHIFFFQLCPGVELPDHMVTLFLVL